VHIRVRDQAQQAETVFRGEIDTLATSMYRHGQIVEWSAVFTSGSTDEFLDQMSALDLLATDHAETLGKLTDVRSQADTARTTAAQAQKRALDATSAAEAAVDTIKQRQGDLDRQIQEVRTALGELNPDDRARLGTVQDNGIYLGPPGAANDAMQAALGKRGSEYEWGATGPNEFDCSGLTSWSYRQASVTIPAYQPPTVDRGQGRLAGRARARRPVVLRRRNRKPRRHSPRQHVRWRRSHGRRTNRRSTRRRTPDEGRRPSDRSAAHRRLTGRGPQLTALGWICGDRSSPAEETLPDASAGLTSQRRTEAQELHATNLDRSCGKGLTVNETISYQG
jgi:cell wall-associated NlpC family hydrolase